MPADERSSVRAPRLRSALLGVCTHDSPGWKIAARRWLVHDAHRLTLKGESMSKMAAKRTGLDVKQDA